jgi:hypothetical protein
MYLLLKKIYSDDIKLIIIVSLLYAILPIVPTTSIGISTIPFAIFFFIKLSENKVFLKRTIFLLLYPFFSTFTYAGIFILFFWLSGIIIFLFKYKNVNINLLIGFLFLCVGYIIVDLQLFYVMFIVKEELNRSVYSTGESISIFKFYDIFKNYIKNGYYHAASMQKIIIIPLSIIVSIFLLIRIYINYFKEKKVRLKILCQDSKITFLVFFIEITIIVFYFISAIHDAKIVFNFIEKYFPILSGFNWGRVWIFNRMLWYILFYLCLHYIRKIKIVSIEFMQQYNSFFMDYKIFNIIVLVLILLQSVNIAISPVLYNDRAITWYNELFIKSGLVNNDTNIISYKEFFDGPLFNKIKKEIFYNNENVAAFGYHPSILMYNGFRCIDGYNNAYPLKYMKKFRSLIEPELNINPEARNYYDKWGGRMYLYSSEIDTQPTRNKDMSPVRLNININVFKNDFNGKYILSRVKISNKAELGLNFRGAYTHEGSIYRIFVYETN